MELIIRDDFDALKAAVQLKPLFHPAYFNLIHTMPLVTPMLEEQGIASNKFYRILLEKDPDSHALPVYFVPDLNTGLPVIVPGGFQDDPQANILWEAYARYQGVPLEPSLYNIPYLDFVELRKLYEDVATLLKKDLRNEYNSHFWGQKSKGNISYRVLRASVSEVSLLNNYLRCQLTYGKEFEEQLKGNRFSEIIPVAEAMWDSYAATSMATLLYRQYQEQAPEPICIFALDSTLPDHLNPIGALLCLQGDTYATASYLVRSTQTQYRPYEISFMLQLKAVEYFYTSPLINKFYFGANLDPNADSYKKKFLSLKYQRNWNYKGPVTSARKIDDKTFAITIKD